MGNWACESNLEACRVQGDFQADRRKSSDYAIRVDNGLLSEEEFCRDGKGWGLAQWTYWTRKRDLYNFCRRRCVSIADEAAQVDFAITELQTQYKALWNDLCSCAEEDLYKMCELVCKEYERPAVNNVQERANAAVKIRDELQAKAAEEIDNGTDPDIFWPPRMLCFSMRGFDVSALQALLLAHGYNCGGVSGIFDNRTKTMTMAYQAENDLVVDGIAGPKTWRKLLEVRA